MAHALSAMTTADTAFMSLTANNPAEESGSMKNVGATGGDSIENGTITAFGYAPAYRRVLGTLAGICIVIALTS